MNLKTDNTSLSSSGVPNFYDSPTTSSSTKVSETRFFLENDTDTLLSSLPKDENREKSGYIATAQVPVLPQPDPDGETGPQPYGAAERKMIMQHAQKKVKDKLKESGLSEKEAETVYHALLNGKELKDAKLKKSAKDIEDAVSKEMQEEANLPASWSLSSTSKEDWVPLPIAPYGTTKQQEITSYYDSAVKQAIEELGYGEQKEKILAAIEGGKVSEDIAPAVVAVTAKAKEQTQQTYALSPSWYPNVKEPELWKPVHVGMMSSIEVNIARQKMLLDNCSEIYQTVDAAVKKLMSQLKENDPNHIPLQDFTTIIAKAIGDLKRVLQKMQLQDADKTAETQKLKFKDIEGRRAKIEENLQAKKDQADAQHAQEKNAKWMNILGPIISVVSIVVGAALLWAGGAGAAVIAAGVAVGVALAAYSVVDSQFGLTQKIGAAINEFVMDLTDDPTIRAIIKAAIGVVLVAIVVVAIVASGGSAAGNIATQTVAQIGKQAALEMGKQLTVQIAMGLIMTTNGFGELAGQIAIAAGADEETQKQIEMITQIVVMGLMLVGMVGLKGFSKGKGVLGTPKDAVEELKESSRSLNQAIKEGIQKIQAYDFTQLPADIADSVTSGAKNWGKGVLLMGKDLIFLSEGKTPEKVLRSLDTALKVTPNGIKIYDGIHRWQTALVIQKLLLAIGENEKAIELTEALIRDLEALLANLQGHQASKGEFLESLQTFYNNLYTTKNQISSQLFQHM